MKKMKRKEYPSDVKFNTWKELITALKYTYTTSFKDVCELLKASRNWVNQYVRPYVPCVYIGSNRTADGSMGANWVKLASLELGKPMTESIWFDTDALYNYLDGCTHSISKQTKSVPVGYLMTPSNYTAYLKEIEKLEHQIAIENSILVKNKLLKEMNECYLKYLSDNEQTSYILNHSLSVTERSKTIPVDLDIKFSDVKEWQAPHDLKGYGDADELIYRRFYKEGYIRAELLFADENGCIGRKIYYAKDTQYLEGEGKRLIIPESVWQTVTNVFPIR